MSRYFTAHITENVPLKPSFNLLTILPLEQTVSPGPGQFYMLQAGSSYDPLLKRPFSILRQDGPALQFLYRIRGKGTAGLSSMKAGERLSVIGPLGNGYVLPEGRFIAVAGGIGLASLFPLLETCRGRAVLFYGARNAEELVLEDEVGALSEQCIIATDDGSVGVKGFVTDELKQFLLSSDGGTLSLPVYACGPLPMLTSLSRTLPHRVAPCYVSLEERMACGVGACLGCVTKTRARGAGSDRVTSRYASVCKEGPVFDLREILW